MSIVDHQNQREQIVAAQRAQPVTEESAFSSLVAAGILDEKGNLLPPYDTIFVRKP